MLRTMIIASAVLMVPGAAVAADAPATHTLERDGIKFEYTTVPGPFGGVTVRGRELPSAAGVPRKPFTLYVSAKGRVTGDYAGSTVEFSAEHFDPASVTSASLVSATQVAAK